MTCGQCAYGPHGYDTTKYCHRLNPGAMELRSQDAPACKQFEKWVPGEVLEDEKFDIKTNGGSRL